MKFTYKLLIKYRGIIFCLFSALISVLNLFHSGLPPTHDGEYHVIRFFEFDKALRDGAWYPIWALDLNYTYGSPLFNYVYPLPNYFASFVHLLGFSFIDSFKTNLFFAVIVGSVGAFVYGRSRFNTWGGVLTSVFYTYAPYHFLDIYIRGSVGEVWALAFFPYSLWLFNRVLKKSSSRNIALASLLYSLIVFSHNILAVMFTGFLAPYLLVIYLESKKNVKTLFLLYVPIILGLLTCSIFIIPALLEEKYVVGLKIFDIEQNFPELFQLLIPSWGSGFSGGSLSNQMSFQVGIANLTVVFLVIIGLLRKRKNLVFYMFLLLSFFTIFILMTPYSTSVWETVPIMSFFQFPWRFLSLEILICAILAGSITALYKSKILYIVLLGFLIFSTYQYARAAYFMDRNDDFYTKNPDFIYSTNSIGNVFQTKWLPFQKHLPNPYDPKKIRVLSRSTTIQRFKVNLQKKEVVSFNTAYFPGWAGYVNSKKTQINENNGKISVNLPKGNYEFMLRFEDTLFRFSAKLLTVVGVLTIILLILKDTVLQYFYARRN